MGPVALIGVIGLSVGVVAPALADDLMNGLDFSLDAAVEVAAVEAGGNRTVGIYVIQQDSACDISAGTPASFSVDNDGPGVGTVSPSSLTFTGCAPQNLTVTGVSIGTAHVTFTQTAGPTISVTGGAFDIVVDAAPSVTSVSPVDGATGVSTGTTVVANFSEPVRFGPLAWRLNCGGAVSGSLTPSVNTPTTSLTFTPIAALPAGTLCTATVVSRWVADTDFADPPNSLTADFVWTFTTQGVDSTPPAITPTVTGSLGTNGWYTSDVDVTWTVTDRESTVTSTTGCGPTTITTDTTGTLLTCEATSGGGTASESVTIKRDATNPSVTVTALSAPNLAGWYTAPVTFDTDGTDATSGISSCTTDQLYSGPDGTALTVNGSCTDNAGNTAGGTSAPFNYDATGPTVTVTPDRVPDSNGWYNAPVTFDTSGTPGAGSPIVDCTAPQLYSGPDGTGLTVPGSCTDQAGNTAGGTSAAFKYDNTDPTISPSVTPAAAPTGWWTGVPTASFTCGDVTSGVATCELPHVFGEGSNQSFTGTAYDNAGNSKTAAVTNIDVDLTAPGAIWNGGPAAGGSYVFGSVPAAPTCTATDALSGPDTCVVTGYATSVGTHVMTATATDVAGNTGFPTRSYTVVPWTIRGLYSPFNVPGTVYGVRSDRTHTLKFELFAGATELTAASAVVDVLQTEVNCSTKAPVAAPIQIYPAPQRGTERGSIWNTLKYETKLGQYVFYWKPPVTSSIRCYAIAIRLADGGSITTYFKASVT